MFSSVDFPQFVYPTIAAVFILPLARLERISSLCFSTWDNSCFKAEIACTDKTTVCLQLFLSRTSGSDSTSQTRKEIP